MAYQETTTTGYGSRVKNSCGAIGTGIVMFFAATALLWWNEGRAVKTADMLDEAQGACVELANPEKIDRALDGELVCASAFATTEDSLSDADYGIGAKAISLQRRVEYYQYVEHSESKKEDKLGGKEVTTTTYTYSKEWVSSPVESGNFHDPAYQQKNTVLATVENQDQWAQNVSFGAYKLNESLIHSISSKEPMEVKLTDDLLKQLDNNTKIAYERFYGATTTKPAAKPAAVDSIGAAVEPSPYEFIHVSNNEIYYGRTPGAPEVGDVKVTFEIVVPAKVTVVAQTTDNTFKAFKAKNGKTFQTLVMGKKDMAEIFDAENSSNSTWTWILRIAGIFLVVFSLKMVFGFIETLLKVVPFISNIVGWGVGIVCTIVGVVWSLIVIAVAWIFYRPLLGIALLVIAGLLIWLFAFKGKDKIKELANKKKE